MRTAGTSTSANMLALSQENLRVRSCHGQINRTSRPHKINPFRHPAPNRGAPPAASC